MLKKLLLGLAALIFLAPGIAHAVAGDSLTWGECIIENDGSVYTAQMTITTNGDYDNTDKYITLPFKAEFDNIQVRPDGTSTPNGNFNVEMRESVLSTDLCYDLTAACVNNAITCGKPIEPTNGSKVVLPKGTKIIPYVSGTGGADIIYINLTFKKVK